MKAKKTQLIFSCCVSLRLCRHVFSVSVSILSVHILCNAHLQAGGPICSHAKSRGSFCQNSGDQGLDCLSSFQTMFHQMALSTTPGALSSLFQSFFCPMSSNGLVAPRLSISFFISITQCFTVLMYLVKNRTFHALIEKSVQTLYRRTTLCVVHC